MILLDVKDDCPDFKPIMHEMTTICTGAGERIFGDNVIMCKRRKLCERHVQYLERRSESL